MFGFSFKMIFYSLKNYKPFKRLLFKLKSRWSEKSLEILTLPFIVSDLSGRQLIESSCEVCSDNN